MNIELNANKCDQSTTLIAKKLREAFKSVEKGINGDFGGTIEHLWIDFELIRHHAEQAPAKPFRFQKKVGGTVFKLTGLPSPVYYNVGHYGVHPDFDMMLSLPIESVPNYALSLIYASTDTLINKQKSLGGFNAEKFRSDFLITCTTLGFQLRTSTNAG